MVEPLLERREPRLTLGEAKEKTLKLLDELDTSASAKDYKQKLNQFFDMGQREVARIRQIIKRYKVTLNDKKGTGWTEYPGYFPLPHIKKLV